MLSKKKSLGSEQSNYNVIMYNVISKKFDAVYIEVKQVCRQIEKSCLIKEGIGSKETSLEANFVQIRDQIYTERKV